MCVCLSVRVCVCVLEYRVNGDTAECYMLNPYTGECVCVREYE